MFESIKMNLVTLIFTTLGLAVAASCKSVPETPTASDDFAHECLQMSITPTTTSGHESGDVELDYELQNICPLEKCFCSWPGAICEPAWTDESGSRHGVLAGVPDPQPCPFDKVTVLKPGAKLTGVAHVALAGLPTGQIDIRCQFQSYGSGETWQVKTWMGTTFSNWVYINVGGGEVNLIQPRSGATQLPAAPDGGRGVRG